MRLLAVYKEATGEEFKGPGYGTGYQGAWRKNQARISKASPDELLKLGEISVELWNAHGEDWFKLLCARTMQRFRVSNPRFLTPGQARSMVEELLQRIAVKRIRARHIYDGLPQDAPISRHDIEEDKEVLRKRFFTAEAQRRGEKTEG